MLRRLGAQAAVHLPVHVDKNGLARRDVAHQFESRGVERDGFGSEHMLGAEIGLALAIDQRADAMRVAERQDAVTGDQDRHGIGALDPAVHGGNGAEDMLRRELERGHRPQFVGKDVEQNFGIGTGVEVAQVFAVKLVAQLVGIGEIAVMRERQAKRRVDENGWASAGESQPAVG